MRFLKIIIIIIKRIRKNKWMAQMEDIQHYYLNILPGPPIDETVDHMTETRGCVEHRKMTRIRY